MKKLLILAGATLLMAACSDSSLTNPSARKAPDKARLDEDFTCRSGYIVAYDENGNPYCAEVEGRSSGAGIVVIPDSTSGAH